MQTIRRTTPMSWKTYHTHSENYAECARRAEERGDDWAKNWYLLAAHQERKALECLSEDEKKIFGSTLTTKAAYLYLKAGGFGFSEEEL